MPTLQKTSGATSGPPGRRSTRPRRPCSGAGGYHRRQGPTLQRTAAELAREQRLVALATGKLVPCSTTQRDFLGHLKDTSQTIQGSATVLEIASVIMLQDITVRSSTVAHWAGQQWPEGRHPQEEACRGSLPYWTYLVGIQEVPEDLQPFDKVTIPQTTAGHSEDRQEGLHGHRSGSAVERRCGPWGHRRGRHDPAGNVDWCPDRRTGFPQVRQRQGCCTLPRDICEQDEGWCARSSYPLETPIHDQAAGEGRCDTSRRSLSDRRAEGRQGQRPIRGYR